MRRLGAEQRQRRPARDRLLAGAPAEAHLRAVERAVEARQLHVVERDREVAERGAHGLTLQPYEQAAPGEAAVLDAARVSEHRVEAIRVEVREQPVAAPSSRFLNSELKSRRRESNADVMR